jgi:DNA-binding GntR family transcriptional regulator
MKSSPLQSRPAISTAYQCIKNSIDQGIWSGQKHLPTLARLAELAKVSRRTMWNAVQLLKNDGIVNVHVGGYITPVRQAVDKIESSPGSGLKWERIRSQLHREIMDGRILANSLLPPVGELMVRFGACSATIRKALLALCEAGCIVPYKRSFRPQHSLSARAWSTVAFLWNVYLPGQKIR